MDRWMGMDRKMAAGVGIALVVAVVALAGAYRSSMVKEKLAGKPAVAEHQGGLQGIAIGEPNPSAPGFDPKNPTGTKEGPQEPGPAPGPDMGIDPVTEPVPDPASGGVPGQPADPTPGEPSEGTEKPAPLDEGNGGTGGGKEISVPAGVYAVLPKDFTVKPGERGIVYVYHGGTLLGEVDGKLILTDTVRTREELVVLVDVAAVMGMEGKAAIKAVDGWLDTRITTVVDDVEVRSKGEVLTVVSSR